jgi:hypothetical protein
MGIGEEKLNCVVSLPITVYVERDHISACSPTPVVALVLACLVLARQLGRTYRCSYVRQWDIARKFFPNGGEGGTGELYDLDGAAKSRLGALMA